MVKMMINKVQAASILMMMALFTVPSLALPGGTENTCYRAELFYEDTSYGEVRLMVSDSASILEVEIEELNITGIYEVQLFKDYYSDFVAGEIEIDEDLKTEATFEIPYRDPDFHVIVKNGLVELRSGEWVECEKPAESVTVKVSPSTLNLKSMGNWVTVKIRVQADSLPTDFKLIVDGESLTPVSALETGDHYTLKFSRKALQSLCEEGENAITVSFKIGDDVIELTDTIKVINEGNHETSSTHEEKNQVKSNNGKAKGKGKNN